MRIDNSNFYSVEGIKYLGITLTNNLRKCLLSFGAQYLSSKLLTNNIMFKIYSSIILPVVPLCVKLGR